MRKQKTNLNKKTSPRIRFLRQLYILNKSLYRRKHLRRFLNKKRIFAKTKSRYDLTLNKKSRIRFKIFLVNQLKKKQKFFAPKKKKIKQTVLKPLYKRAYIRGEFFKTKFAKYRYKTTRKYVLNRLRRKFPLIRSAIIHIKLRRRNTFLTCNSSRKRTLFTSSTGTFKYDGRKKSTSFARERLARKVAQKLVRNHFRVVDIYFVSKVGQFYRAIVKAVISTGLIIRMLRIKRIHSHGMIRPKKAKRK